MESIYGAGLWNVCREYNESEAYRVKLDRTDRSNMIRWMFGFTLKCRATG